jgi:protein TonB
MVRRRLLTLSASAALHLAAIGLALVIAGVGAGSAVLIDLVADVEDEAASEARARSLTGSASATSERAQRAPAGRLAATPSPPVPSAPAPMPAPAPSGPAVVEPAPAPSPDVTAETRPKPEPQPETEAGAPMARPDPASPPALASQGAKPRDEGAATPGAPSGVDGGTSSVASLRAGSAAGANTASAALGTPGEARGGIPAEYGLYYEAFRRRVQESLRYPLAARRQGLSGRVELEVLVEPSGRIRAVRVISSSSHPVLDDAALQAVRRLPPEPLPDRLPRRPLRIILPLGFELE